MRSKPYKFFLSTPLIKWSKNVPPTIVVFYSVQQFHSLKNSLINQLRHSGASVISHRSGDNGTPLSAKSMRHTGASFSILYDVMQSNVRYSVEDENELASNEIFRFWVDRNWELKVVKTYFCSYLTQSVKPCRNKISRVKQNCFSIYFDFMHSLVH